MSKTATKIKLPLSLEARRTVNISEGDVIEYAATIDTNLEIELTNNPSPEQVIKALGDILRTIVYNAAFDETLKSLLDQNKPPINDVS